MRATVLKMARGRFWGLIWRISDQVAKSCQNLPNMEAGKHGIGLVWGRRGSVWAETCCGKRYWAQVSLWTPIWAYRGPWGPIGGL